MGLGPPTAHTGCNQESLSMSTTANNQLQDTNNDYVYDSAGNLTQPGPIGGPYVYDAENHLTSAGGVTYTYDGDGNRVMKSNGTIYWYGANSASLEESDLSGNLQRWYYFFDGQRVGRQLTTNEVGFYMTDHLGNVRYLGGSSTGYSLDYYPFGAVILNSDTGDDRYQFTGKERDSESGLDNFGARYNSSSMGRFMSPDWSASPSPVPYASLPYPQSLNLYSYVQNNPLKSTDPTGHCTVDGEKHNWIWCAGHSLGITETKKETAAREKAEAETREYLRRHPEILRNAIFTAVTLGTAMAIEAGGMGSGEDGNSTVTPEESTAIEAGAATGAETGVARTMANGVPQPAAEGEIIVGPNGTAVKIPAGYVAEPAANGNGIVYRQAGSTGDANTIRIMGPDAQGRYPNGYVRVYNSSGQPVIPSTGKPGTQAQTHTPQ